MKNSYVWLMIMLTALLTACGGGGGGDSVGSSTGDTGIAVDPYIVGAQLEEISADGQTLLQRSSQSSDASGRFTFSQTITDGSIIRIKTAAQGRHAGAPYEGILKRQVFDSDARPVVVSPLTTLIANGMAPAAVLNMMDQAGLTGLTEKDLFADPMADLINRTSSMTEADLVLLRANMAAYAFMAVTENFNYGGIATAAEPAVRFADCADAVKTILNPVQYQQLSQTVGSDFSLGDLANTAARINNTVIDSIRNEVAAGSQTVPLAMIDQFVASALMDVETIASDIYQARTGGGGGGSTPVADPANGQDLFLASFCNDCHTVGGGSGTMELSGDGTIFTNKFSGGKVHNGSSFTESEIADVAAYLDGQNGGSTTDPGTAPGTDPGTPTSGSDLYATECASCHGDLQNSDINDRTAAGIQAAIDADLGGMGGLMLTAEQVQVIADSMPVVQPPTTEEPPQTVDRTGQQVYDQECAVCHMLGTHDISGSNSDLAGLGSGIVAQVESGHMDRDLTTTPAERTALADFVDTFQPVADGGGEPTGSCTSCHGQPPAGSNFPDTAGAHAVHAALSAVGTNCDTCHTGNTHDDGFVDLGFPAEWDAQSGMAIDNMEGTCSNIICHGGQTTPDWTTETINVDTQCQSCHEAGTAQFNGYWSGKHKKHVDDKGYSCTVCHDPTELQNGHFGDLSTPEFETDPVSSLRSSINYDGQSCSMSCHGRDEGNW